MIVRKRMGPSRELTTSSPGSYAHDLNILDTFTRIVFIINVSSVNSSIESFLKVKLLPGGVLSPKLYVDVTSLYQFSHNNPPVSIPFFESKSLDFAQTGPFSHNLLKIHPICVIWALMKTHRSPYQISRNSIPKSRHI